jgi:hypothetical protein
MVLKISVFDYQVLSLDPSVIAQALLKRFVNGGCGRPASIILETSKNTDPARRPLRSRTRRTNEQSRSNRNELSPPHLITQQITEALGRIPHAGLGVAGAKLHFSRTGLELTMHQSILVRADEVLE